MSQQLISQYVEAALMYHSQLDETDLPELQKIAKTHLASGGNLVNAEATLENVSSFFLLILSKSKMLGQNSLHQTRLRWFKPAEAGETEIDKVALFLGEMAKSFSEKKDIGIAVQHLILTGKHDTVWDVFCNFPLLIR